MLVRILGAAAAVALCGVAAAQSVCIPGFCEAPENSAGTANLPGPCAFRPAEGGTLNVFGDLPEGTYLRGTFTIDSFFDIAYQTGGSLGGEVQQYRAFLDLNLQGTGKLTGFQRQLQIPVDITTSSGPRGDGSVQSFPTEMIALQGELLGDPDFDQLRITAGRDFGLPSPGRTTLTRLGGGTFNVDSFFDVEYRIEFVGAPGSILEKSSGNDVGTIAIRNSDETPGEPCQAPDNGSGTVDHPAPCPYRALGSMQIVDGLPPDARIGGTFVVDSFFDVTYQVGGTLGGEVASGTALGTLALEGEGALAGFSREIALPLEVSIHSGPRTNGDPHQRFDTEIVSMQGQLFGDPDFDTLRLTAGGGHGLPSPGATTLTRLPDGSFNVDSFFDVEYRIEFVGAPGGALDGLAGTTESGLRMHQGFGRSHGYSDRFGLHHRPLGAACLDPTGDRLTISNIGSSGKDGVSIDLGEGGASGWAARLDVAPGLELPHDMHVWIDGLLPDLPGAGTTDDPLHAFGVHVSQVEEATQVAFDPNLFGQPPATVRYEAWLGGTLVGAVTLAGPIVPLVGTLGTSAKDGVTFAVDCDDDCDVAFEVHTHHPAEFLTPLGAVLADEVRLCVELQEGAWTAPFATIDVRAANLPQLEIVDEALGMFCHDHRALGAAHLAGEGDHLVVSNIGSSGLDGVAVDLDDVSDCDLCTCLPGWTLDFGPAGALPSSGGVHLRALLPGLAGPECVWCVDIESSSDGRASISADFTRLNPTAIAIDLFRNGTVVASDFHAVPDVQGPLVISNIGSSGEDGVSIDLGASGGDMTWTIRSPQPGPSDLPGQKPVFADEIRITALDVDDDCDGIASVPVAPPAPRYEIVAENLPQLVILDERRTVPCVGDINGDGWVNVVDLVTVILSWGKADASGDVNGDGFTDVTDLVELVLNWGPCEPQPE